MSQITDDKSLCLHNSYSYYKYVGGGHKIQFVLHDYTCCRYSRATSMMMSNYHQQPIYSTSDTFNSMITTSYSYSNFTTSDSAGNNCETCGWIVTFVILNIQLD